MCMYMYICNYVYYTTLMCYVVRCTLIIKIIVYVHVHVHKYKSDMIYTCWSLEVYGILLGPTGLGLYPHKPPV